jgi:hypothetical protein
MAHRQGDPEVGDQRVAVPHQDVLGLDVAMHHALLVRVLQRRGDRLREAHGLIHRQLLLAVDLVSQGLSLDIGHHVEQEPLGRARVVQRQDVTVLQVGGDLDLLEEPLGADHGGQFRPQHLERDLAVVLDVVRQVHRRHAALAQLALDDVAIGDRGLQTFGDLAHSPIRSCWRVES